MSGTEQGSIAVAAVDYMQQGMNLLRSLLTQGEATLRSPLFGAGDYLRQLDYKLPETLHLSEGRDCTTVITGASCSFVHPSDCYILAGL